MFPRAWHLTISVAVCPSAGLRSAVALGYLMSLFRMVCQSNLTVQDLSNVGGKGAKDHCDSLWLGLDKVRHMHFMKEFKNMFFISLSLWHIFINLMKSKSTLCLSMCQVMNNVISIFNWPDDSSLKVQRDGSPSLKPTCRRFSCAEHW